MWLAGQLLHQGRRHHLSLSSLHRLPVTTLRLFSPSAGRTEASPPPPPAKPAHSFIVDYLVSSCGFSSADALRASKPLSHLKSPDRPDAVLRFLRQEGLGDAHIQRAVRMCPKLLLADPTKTLQPKIGAFRDAGFSSSEIAQLMSLNPNVFYLRDVLRRVEFWRKLVGTNENIFRTMKRDARLLCYNLEKKAIPGLALLRGLGIPENKMRALVLTRSRLVAAKAERIESLVEQIKSLGFSPGSPMFVEALFSLDNLSRSTFDSKLKHLRSFGWTQAELVSVIQRFPSILKYSEKKVNAVMNFLLNEAGYDPSHVVRLPALVGYSIEKRLKPRLFILQSLKVEGLLGGRKDLLTAMFMSEDNFIRKYIVPYKDRLSQLDDAHHIICAKNAKVSTSSS